MKHVLLGLIVFSLMSLIGCTTPPENNPDIEDKITELKQDDFQSSYMSWLGRYHIKNDQAYFYYTATGFEVSIYGRVVQIELSLQDKQQDIYYIVIKDDEDIFDAETYVQRNTRDILTVTFDDFGYHHLKILKRSEPEDGITSLVRVSTNGEFLELEEKPLQPHFLMLGASGISGHGALGQVGQNRLTINSSPFHSFGYLTAHHFGGSFEFVSSSGWGLKYGFNDRSGEENIAIAYNYVGITPDRTIVYESFLNQQTPDYIIINLGGNDYTSVINRTSGFDQSEKIRIFKESVASFLLELRSDAPYAHIIWTMTEGSLNGAAAKEVIARLDESDALFVHVVTIQQVGQDGDPVGANNHASYFTHQKSALSIIDLITSLKTS